MKFRSGRGPDSTAEAAIGDVAGESVLVQIFTRIQDEQDRALILAHIGLGIPLTGLEQQFRQSRRELATRVDAILMTLREDASLADMLADVHRAGRDEHFQAIIVRLGLEDWFCAYCGKFMAQPVTGRRRRTCSSLCRHRLSQSRLSPLDGNSTYRWGAEPSMRLGTIKHGTSVPVVVQLAADIERNIDRGWLAPGTRLPTEAQLAAHYGVARTTVRHAIAALREHAKVVTVRGRGTYVSSTVNTR